MRPTKRVLYITYDGLLEPLGQSQVLAYLEKLSNAVDIKILSFEKSRDLKNKTIINQLKKRLSEAKISWTVLRYHKTPSLLATTYDITLGLVVSLYLIQRHKLNIIHARSYVAALIALGIKKICGITFLFDMRGLWIDERVEGGIWEKDTYLVKFARYFEDLFFLHSDTIITLTDASVNLIENRINSPIINRENSKIEVIPTCVDTKKFYVKNDNISTFTVGNLGSLGTWYLVDHIFEFFKEICLLRTDAKLLFVNKHQHSLINNIAVKSKVHQSKVQILAASYDDVPAKLILMSIGLLFYKTGLSRAACSPTRLGEYLSAGVPCIVSEGVGDCGDILEGEGVGVVIPRFTKENLRESAVKIIELSESPEISERCAQVAKRYFDLENGVKRYRNIYFKKRY